MTEAVQDSTDSLEGYLYKKGELNTSFKKRYFVLKEDYNKKGIGSSSGFIPIEECNIIMVEENKHERNNTFELSSSVIGNRIFVLAADNHESMQNWINTLRRIVFKIRRDKNKFFQASTSNAKNTSSNTGSSELRKVIEVENFDLPENVRIRSTGVLPPLNIEHSKHPLSNSSFISPIFKSNQSLDLDSEHNTVLEAWKSRNLQIVAEDHYSRLEDPEDVVHKTWFEKCFCCFKL